MSAKNKKNPQTNPSSNDQTPSPDARVWGGFIASIREWGDALVIAYLLAMFIRMFVAELYKIPSPSMTPTLLGTEMPRNGVGYYDVNEDGKKDLILRSGSSSYASQLDAYTLEENGRYNYAGEVQGNLYYDIQEEEERLNKITQKKSNVFAAAMGWVTGIFSSETEDDVLINDRIAQRQDRILVGKFLYWFSPPERGDIVVFKTPAFFDRRKPIYIKRVVGLSEEELSFEPAEGPPGHETSMSRLMVNGKRVETPSFFQQQLYETRDQGHISENKRLPYTTYRDYDTGVGYATDIVSIDVPKDSVYVFGDNTISSLDSRYWGKVPFSYLRGRAVFRYNMRYFPFTKFPGFLK